MARPVRATGNYTREEAIAAIDREGMLTGVRRFDPSGRAKYHNGRVFMTTCRCPPRGLMHHARTPTEFPYLGSPHGVCEANKI
jgi:hypothetical protein